MINATIYAVSPEYKRFVQFCKIKGKSDEYTKNFKIPYVVLVHGNLIQSVVHQIDKETLEFTKVFFNDSSSFPDIDVWEKEQIYLFKLYKLRHTP